MTDPLARSFDALLDTLREQAAWLRDHPFSEDEENRPGAYSFLISTLIARLEEEVLFDPDFPTFRVVDPRVRGAGDNADQRYLISRLAGGQTYRLRGRIGAERRVEFQVYAGDPWSGGRSAGFLTHEQLDVDDDGNFEVIASPERQPGNWIENPPDGTRILVRQTYGAWPDRDMGEIHIDRVGHEGDLRPRLTADDLATRLGAAADRLGSDIGVWPEMVRGLHVDSRPPNRLSDPVDPGAAGGVSGRFMVFGTWDLSPDEALVVTTWPSDGTYQGIQLCDLWWSSLEYANRQTSLTADQARLGPDGTYTFVIAGTDPGLANWLDTTGLRRGVIMLRYDGMTRSEFDPAQRPTARVLTLAELGTALGPGQTRIDDAGRRAAIAARRRHVQARFNI